MRVLVTIVEDYYPSGTGFAQAFYNLHRSLIENNSCDQIIVLTTKQDAQSTDERIVVKKINKIKGLRLLQNKLLRKVGKLYIKNKINPVLQNLKDVVENNDIQMILLESMFMAWAIPFIKEVYPSIPVVCRIHGTGPEYTAYLRNRIVTKYNDYLLQELFRNKNIAVTTEYYIRFFMELFPDYAKFMDKNFFIIPNTTTEMPLRNLPNSDSTVTLLQLGRMNQMGYHQKGFQDTIKALLYIEEIMPELARKLHYISIGTGEMEKEFINISNKLNIVQHTHYSKLPNEEVKKIEQKVDVILLPSRCEGMSMFATEVLAAGKPIIYTKYNGLDCLCKDGFNALGMDYYDYLKMAECIIKFASDNAFRKQCAANSSLLFEKEYSYKAVAMKYEVAVRYLKGWE